MKKVVKKIFSKQLLLLVVICILLLIIHLAQAWSKEYQGDSNKRLNITISEEGVNRIGVEGDRIAKVIGNGEEYSIEGDSRRGIIFISSKISGGNVEKRGKVLPITIVTEKGFVQDISLKVKRGREARSIVIKKPVLKGNNASEQKRSTGIVDIKQKVIEAIREVSRGDTRNYSFRRIDIKSLSRSREGLAYRVYKGLAERGEMYKMILG